MVGVEGPELVAAAAASEPEFGEIGVDRERSFFCVWTGSAGELLFILFSCADDGLFVALWTVDEDRVVKLVEGFPL